MLGGGGERKRQKYHQREGDDDQRVNKARSSKTQLKSKSRKERHNRQSQDPFHGTLHSGQAIPASHLDRFSRVVDAATLRHSDQRFSVASEALPLHLFSLSTCRAGLSNTERERERSRSWRPGSVRDPGIQPEDQRSINRSPTRGRDQKNPLDSFCLA